MQSTVSHIVCALLNTVIKLLKRIRRHIRSETECQLKASDTEKKSQNENKMQKVIKIKKFANRHICMVKVLSCTRVFFLSPLLRQFTLLSSYCWCRFCAAGNLFSLLKCHVLAFIATIFCSLSLDWMTKNRIVNASVSHLLCEKNLIRWRLAEVSI